MVLGVSAVRVQRGMVIKYGDCAGGASFPCVILQLSIKQSMKRCVVNCFKSNGARVCAVLSLLIVSISLQAQDGSAGIQEANTKVRGYFSVGCDLMYAVGAILGLIGAVRVYQKWSNGHPDTGSTAAAWFGSCVFLVVVATVIKSFFGIQ